MWHSFPVTIWRDILGAATGPRSGRRSRDRRQLRRRPPRPPARAAPCPRGCHGDLPVIAVTFEPHPLAVIAPESAPQAPHHDAATRRAAAAAGADEVRILAFSAEMAAWSPQEFIDRVMVAELHAARVAVGANFRFGCRAERQHDPAAGGRRGGRLHGRRPGARRRGGAVLVHTGPRPRRRRTHPRGRRSPRPTARGHRCGAPGRPARTRARLSDGERPRRRGVRGPAGRRVRRVAGPRRRRPTARRDLGRHESDLRRDRASGGVVRPGPHGPGSVRRGRSGSSSSTGCAAWSPSTASRTWSTQMADDVSRTRTVLALDV